MAKLMGLDYPIQYKKGKENVVADALLRRHEEGSVAAITIIIPEWCQQVIESYEGDNTVRELLEKVAMGSEGVEGYTLVDGMSRH